MVVGRAYAGGVTIHSDHPFATPEEDKDPLRRLRGRLAAPVTVWAVGAGGARSGLTVSSVLIADGDPPHVVGLIDAESDFWLEEPQRWVINVLAARHRFLADAFAGTAPSPGGPFRLGEWTDTAWGPALVDAAGWLGVSVGPDARKVGWRALVEATVEHVEAFDRMPLVHLRGRYLDVGQHLSE